MLGTAADIPYEASANAVRTLRAFTGIGKSGTTQLVRHVDVRSSASTSSPTVWNY
jgi:hypothetical protein